MKSFGRFSILFALIIAGGTLANTWAYLGEVHVDRKELRDFPQVIGEWRQSGGDQIIDDETMKVLRASDYLLRDYHNAKGEIANLYVGFYASQRDGATYHSPLNCLPGAGWVMTEPAKLIVEPHNGRPAFEVNRYLIQNGESKSVLVYWYQGRGRRISSEYWGKLYQVFDSVRLRRSDAAMVRVTVPVHESEGAALKLASELSASASDMLPAFVPD